MKKLLAVPTRVHDRKIDRAVAKARMKKEGIQHPCKHDHVQGLTVSGKHGEISIVDSYFAKHWREYVS